jgi:hypothetical protein
MSYRAWGLGLGYFEFRIFGSALGNGSPSPEVPGIHPRFGPSTRSLESARRSKSKGTALMILVVRPSRLHTDNRPPRASKTPAPHQCRIETTSRNGPAFSRHEGPDCARHARRLQHRRRTTISREGHFPLLPLGKSRRARPDVAFRGRGVGAGKKKFERVGSPECSPPARSPEVPGIPT